MGKGLSVSEKAGINNAIWDSYYREYQKESDMPGVRYPNEHLVRFINTVSGEAGGRGKKVLELGFGTVANMMMMERCGYEVLGLEVSADAVKRARQAIDTRGLSGRLKVDLFSGMPFPAADSSVDIIVGLQCVYYNLDQASFAKECSRVLRPGGKIFLSFFSRRHGYMQYIKGEPGSIVRFNDDHPNPRLRGLELFLFRSREQFNDIYGKYFDIAVGLDEFDLYPINMSWYYLAGQKSPGDRPFRYEISSPSLAENALEKTSSADVDAIEKKNRLLWDRKYESMYGKETLVPGSAYPNEYLIRFLATRERGGLDKFYTQIGKEDDIRSENEKILELMPLNITNLLMAGDLGYDPHGASPSSIVAARSCQALRAIGRDKDIFIERSRAGSLPYGDAMFRVVISEKAGSYMADQEGFVREIARVLEGGGETFIGYLSPRHGYMKWAKGQGGGYYEITSEHPDPTMRGMVLYVREKDALKRSWDRFFDTEIKTVEYDLHRYFSSFYFVKAVKK